MLKDYLVEIYGYNEPIFINEICMDGMNDNTIRQYFKRMVKSGDLMRYDTGIYYLPKESRLLNKSYLDPVKVIYRKYIENNVSTFGYFAGATFANQIGLTTQMPAVIEIVTNKEATKGRLVSVGNQKVRLKRSQIPVTRENADMLQLIDAVGQIDKYTELEKKAALNLLKEYIRKKGFMQSELSATVSAMTGQTAKKLIEGGLIYEFASG